MRSGVIQNIRGLQTQEWLANRDFSFKFKPCFLPRLEKNHRAIPNHVQASIRPPKDKVTRVHGNVLPNICSSCEIRLKMDHKQLLSK